MEIARFTSDFKILLIISVFSSVNAMNVPILGCNKQQTKKEKAVMILLNRLLSKKVVLSIGLLTDSFSVSVRMYNTVEFELNYYNNLLYFISSFCRC